MKKRSIVICKECFGILLALCMVLSGIMAAPGPKAHAEETIRTTVSDLTITPNTVDKGTKVEVDYRIDSTYTGTAGGYFRNGQTTEVETDLYDYFTGSEFSEDVHHAVTDEVIGKISYAPGKIIITWNKTAESYRMTNYTGGFHVEYEFKAKDINTTATPLTKQVSVGEATADVTWAAKPIYLQKSKSGQGTISPSDSVEFTDTMRYTSLTLTPSDGETVVSAVLTRADGIKQTLNVPAVGGQIYIYKTSLTVGTNRLHVTFSDSSGGTAPTPADPKPPSEYEKRTAGSDYSFSAYQGSVSKIKGNTIDNKYVPMTMTLNHTLLTPLFAAKDDNKLFPSSAKFDDMTLWDELPDDAAWNFNIPGDGGIYAVLPYYKYNKYDYPVPVDGRSGQGWYRMVDVRPYMTEISRKKGESDKDYFNRLNAANKPVYSITTNSSNGRQIMRLYLGATDSGALKYSQVFPKELADDPVYAQVFGDDNAVNGTIQCFVIKYSDDHSKQTWGGTYRNLAQCQWPSVMGATGFRQSWVEYDIRGVKSRVRGGGGDLEVYYYDKGTGKGIQGGKFALEKKDDASGSYVAYTFDGEQVSGITADEDGYLMLKNLIPGDYRLVKTNTVPGYEKSKTTYSAGPGNNGTNMSENCFTVASGASASVVLAVSEERDMPVNVYYDANKGTGELKDEKNPYQAGDQFTVKSPKNAVSRPGYYFSGWNDKADGKGTVYPVGARFTLPDHDVTLYAQWTKNNKVELASPSVVKTLNITDLEPEGKETFTFELTASTENPASPEGLKKSASIEGVGSIPHAFGESVYFDEAGSYTFIVKEKKGNADNYTYDSTEHIWRVVVGTDGYDYTIEENTIDGKNVSDSGQISFTNTYAKSVTPPQPQEKYTITYDLNGGSYKGSTEKIEEEYVKDSDIKIHEAPVRDGHTFLYWKGSEYQPGDTYKVVGDHTFVAQWRANNTPGDTPGDNPGDTPGNDPGSDPGGTITPDTEKKTTDVKAANETPTATTSSGKAVTRTAATTKTINSGDSLVLLPMLGLLLAAGIVLISVIITRRRRLNQ